MADQWETVSRSSKKHNQKPQNLKNNGHKQDKRFEKALGNPDVVDKTSFEALAPKERREKTDKPSTEKVTNEASKMKSSIPRPAKKDTGVKKPNGKKSLEAVLKGVCCPVWTDGARLKLHFFPRTVFYDVSYPENNLRRFFLGVKKSSKITLCCG